jgi:hypothetical protein
VAAGSDRVGVRHRPAADPDVTEPIAVFDVALMGQGAPETAPIAWVPLGQQVQRRGASDICPKSSSAHPAAMMTTAGIPRIFRDGVTKCAKIATIARRKR